MITKTIILAIILSLVPAVAIGANLVIPTNGVVINGERLPADEISSMVYASGHIQIVADGWTLMRDGSAPLPPIPPPLPLVATCLTPTLANTATPKSWRSFWGAAFPQTVDPIKHLDIGRSGYNYVSFNTGNVSGNGAVILITTTTSPGLRVGSISACPGDFNVADVCKGIWGINGWIAYSTNGAAGTCQLSSNTDYYMNFTFTDGEDAATSTCSDSRCLVEIQVGFRAE